jgi:hypothetical protein
MQPTLKEVGSAAHLKYGTGPIIPKESVSSKTGSRQIGLDFIRYHENGL